MPARKRDPGMSESEAQDLASVIRAAGVERVSVEPDDEYFIVEVFTQNRRSTLYAEEDWGWLRDSILGR